MLYKILMKIVYLQISLEESFSNLLRGGWKNHPYVILFIKSCGSI